MSASAFIHCLHKPTASLAGNAKGNISDHIPLSNLQDIIYLENTSKLAATNANANPIFKNKPTHRFNLLVSPWSGLRDTYGQCVAVC